MAIATHGTASNYLQRAPSPSGLADVVDLILDKGLVIDAYVRIAVIGIELITIDARIVIASVDTYLRFAEAVNRLDLTQVDEAKGLPDLFGERRPLVDFEQVEREVFGTERERLCEVPLPAREGLAVEVALLERIAEHAERADDDVGIADRLADLPGEPRDVLAVQRLPEERLDALEAVRQDLPQVAGRVIEPRPDHRTDADILKRVRHSSCSVRS